MNRSIDSKNIQTFFRKLGVEFTLEECFEIVNTGISKSEEKLISGEFYKRSQFNFQPGNMVITFSPYQLSHIMSDYMIKNGLGITDKRFKKYNEEVFPITYFAVAFKMMGLGDSYLLIQESPDIGIKFLRPNEPMYLMATPDVFIEVINVPERAISRKGFIDYWDVATFVAAKKFNKRYGDDVILLIVLQASTIDFDLDALSNELQRLGSPFFSIWFIAETDMGEALIARLFPALTSMHIYREDHSKYYY